MLIFDSYRLIKLSGQNTNKSTAVPLNFINCALLQCLEDETDNEWRQKRILISSNAKSSCIMGMQT